MTRVLHFQAVESRGHEWLEALAATAISRMRPDRQPSRLVRNRDRVFDRQPLLWHERSPGAAEIAHECVPEVSDDASRNKCSRDMRAPNRAAVGLVQNFVQGQWYPQPVQLLDDFCGTRMAMRAQLAQSRLKCIQMREVQRQQVNFVVVLKRAQLAAGDDPNAERVASCPGGGNAIDRIVIRQRERGESAPLRSFDYAFGGKDSIRSGRVRVQVDMGRPARIRTHRS